jgi:hypothetical protein
MRKGPTAFFSLILLFLSFAAPAQKQLLLLKKGKVLYRFLPGDGIYIKLKGNPDRIHSYLNNILDDAIVLHHDTIPFHTIERTYVYESAGRNTSGGTLVAAGVILFSIDQVNSVIIQKNDFEINSGVTITSLAFITAGLPLMLIKKKSQVLSYKYRLMTVKEGDPMYR